MINNGHTIQVNLPKGGSLALDGRQPQAQAIDDGQASAIAKKGVQGLILQDLLKEGQQPVRIALGLLDPSQADDAFERDYSPRFKGAAQVDTGIQISCCSIQIIPFLWC